FALAMMLGAGLLAIAPAPLSAQASAPARGPDRAPADLVALNGRIYTADGARPVVQAIAVRDGRIVFAGDERGARALVGPETETLDLAGRTMIPGMTDAHAHVAGLGESLRNVDLTGTTSYDQVIARV